MLLNKKEIAKCFNAASKTYDQEALVQREAARILTSLLFEQVKGFYPLSILDVGTGTGYVPGLLMNAFPESQYTLNDIAPKMLEKAKERFSDNIHCSFSVGDIEEVLFEPHDLIISNLALQWVDHFEAMLSKFYALSKVMAFSCLLEGTFEEWSAMLNANGIESPVKKYSTAESIEAFLQLMDGCSYRTVTAQIRVQFQGARSFMHYLKNLGASVGVDRVPIQKMKMLIENCQDQFEVTYNLFFAVVRRI